jgi:hypothetical protein
LFVRGHAATEEEAAMIKGLHYNAHCCRNSAETRRFYEDFLDLRLGAARSRSRNRRAGARLRPQDEATGRLEERPGKLIRCRESFDVGRARCFCYQCGRSDLAS